VTLGNLAVAASVVAMLAAGPRVLGHGPFVGFALAWTATTLFGYGLAMPTEQLMSRRLNARASSSTRDSTRRLIALATTASAIAAVWATGSLAADTYTFMLPAVLVGIWGWTLAAVVRGRVAGHGDLRSYAWLFGAEAFVRLVLVGAAILLPGAGAVLIGCAVGAPILVAGTLGVLVPASTRSRPSPAVTHKGVDAGQRTEQLSFIVVAVGYQVCLNAAPIVLEWRVGQTAPESVGAFVVASSYYRLASVLAGGYATPALVALSRAWARRDVQAFSGEFRRAVFGVSMMAAAATTAAAAVAPLLLPLLYGRRPEVEPTVLVALATSTVVAAAAAVAGTALMAVGRASTAAACWLAGAVVLLTVVALDDRISELTALGTVAAPTLTLAGVLLAVRRLRRGLRTEGAT
jgi:O-antigen/teichoic acid export membrane protein